ncbi:hypothetical protein SBADM41S_07917 [Streptomyces badius]
MGILRRLGIKRSASVSASVSTAGADVRPCEQLAMTRDHTGPERRTLLRVALGLGAAAAVHLVLADPASTPGRPARTPPAAAAGAPPANVRGGPPRTAWSP